MQAKAEFMGQHQSCAFGMSESIRSNDAVETKATLPNGGLAKPQPLGQRRRGVAVGAAWLCLIPVIDNIYT